MARQLVTNAESGFSESEHLGTSSPVDLSAFSKSEKEQLMVLSLLHYPKFTGENMNINHDIAFKGKESVTISIQSKIFL